MMKDWKRGQAEALVLLTVAIGLVLACRPSGAGVPAGPATQPVQGSGEDSDTSPPALPEKLGIAPDTTLVVARPDSGDFYYRTLIQVAFHDTTSGITIKKVFYRYNGTIVGGNPKLGPRGTYVIQVEDRGPKWKPLEALVDSIRAEPGVFSAGPTPFRARTNERDSLGMAVGMGRAAAPLRA
jgi:hypothetical protein